MAGARGRKLDLTALIQGGHNTASIIANTDQSGGIGGLLNGIAGGITKYGANRREDTQRADAKAERESVRAEERGYRAKRDSFSDSLALKSDARAESDQRMQEEEHRDKVAINAKGAYRTATLLAQAKAAAATGMPLDRRVTEEILKWKPGLDAAGGPMAALAEAAGQWEPDIEGLRVDAEQLKELHKFVLTQAGVEKDPVEQGKLFDASKELVGKIVARQDRIRLYDANTKNEAEATDARAKADASAVENTRKGKLYARTLGERHGLPEATIASIEGVATDEQHAKDLIAIEVGKMKPAKDAAERVPVDPTARAAYDRDLADKRAAQGLDAEGNPPKPTKPDKVFSDNEKADKALKSLAGLSYDDQNGSVRDIPTDELGALFRRDSTAPEMKTRVKSELDRRREMMSPESFNEALYGYRKAAPAAATVDVKSARAVFDREVKSRGLDPSSSAAKQLAEDIKAGRVR